MHDLYDSKDSSYIQDLIENTSAFKQLIKQIDVFSNPDLINCSLHTKLPTISPIQYKYTMHACNTASLN